MKSALSLIISDSLYAHTFQSFSFCYYYYDGYFVFILLCLILVYSISLFNLSPLILKVFDSQMLRMQQLKCLEGELSVCRQKLPAILNYRSFHL